MIMIMNRKGHLIEEGLKEIHKRKKLMNLNDARSAELKIESTGDGNVATKSLLDENVASSDKRQV